MHIMENNDLFGRASELRRESTVGLKLCSAAMSGEKSSINAYESWLRRMGEEHPEELRIIARNLEERVNRVGELLDDIHSGKGLKDKDMVFLEQVLRDVKPADLTSQDTSS